MIMFLTESAKTTELGGGPFNDRASGQQLEVMQRRQVFEELQSETTPRPLISDPFDQGTSIDGICPDAAQPAEAVAQRRKQ